MADTAWITHILAELARRYNLRGTYVPFSFSVPVAVNAVVQPSIYTVPSNYPLLILRWSYASNRVYDGRIIRLSELRTDQVQFLVNPSLLDAVTGRVTFGHGWDVPQPIRLEPNEKLRVNLVRVFNIDPAEAYPGVANPSILDLVAHGLWLMPKGRKNPDDEPPEG